MEKYVVVDIETTGAHPVDSEIIEIGAVCIEDGKVIGTFNELVKPINKIPEYITGITNITDEMVEDAKGIQDVLPRFIEFCDNSMLIGHNIILFDYRLLKIKASQIGYKFEKKGIDTLVISRKMLANLPSRKLGDLCTYYGISLENAHRAYHDAFATYELFENLRRDFIGIEPELFKARDMVFSVPKKEPMTIKQKKYLESLCKNHKLDLPSNYDKLTKSECSKQIDAIILKYGRVIR